MMQHFMPPGSQPPQAPGAPPQPGAAPPAAPPLTAAAPPTPQGAQPHPLQQHVTGDPIQQELLTRASKLSEQDTAAFAQGVSPQAANVLKKMLPEIGFLLDHVLGGQSMAPQPGSMPPAAPPPAPSLPQPPAGAAPTGLSRFTG